MSDCISCGEQCPLGECPESKRACGHHCDCSWTQDRCHWCGTEFGEVEYKLPSPAPSLEAVMAAQAALRASEAAAREWAMESRRARP